MKYVIIVLLQCRLDYRVNEWDPDFKNYLQTLDKNKPIVMCGDLNVAHHEIGRERRRERETERCLKYFTLHYFC